MRLGIKAGMFVCMAAGVLALSACQNKEEAKAGATEENHAAATVSVAVVEEANAPLIIVGSGSISAWQEAPIGSQVGGLTAVALLVDEGQYVQKGQPLMKMDDVLLRASYNQAVASANQAEKAFARSRQIFEKGYLSQAGYDNAEAAHLSAQAALASAKAQLDQATIRAPVSGVITSRTAVLGQIVQSGAELFRIVRDGRIELNMDVTDTDLSRIKPGMPAKVTSESVGTVDGSVRIVTSALNPETRLGTARISVPWSSGLRPGMFATGQIEAGSGMALIVPQLAVVYVNNEAGVYVVGPENKVRFTKVKTGTRIGNKVVITEGLTVGQKVVTTGAGFLVDGDDVKIVSTAAPDQPVTAAEQ